MEITREISRFGKEIPTLVLDSRFSLRQGAHGVFLTETKDNSHHKNTTGEVGIEHNFSTVYQALQFYLSSAPAYGETLPNQLAIAEEIVNKMTEGHALIRDNFRCEVRVSNGR